MIEFKEIELHNTKYLINKFGRKEGRKVHLELLSLIIPLTFGVMPSVLSSGITNIAEQEKEVAALMPKNKQSESKMLDTLFKALMNKDLVDYVDKLVEKLLSQVLTIDKLEVLKDYDRVFADKTYTHEFLLCLEVVKYNGFFEELGELKEAVENQALDLTFQLT